MRNKINFTSGKKILCVLTAGVLLLSACGTREWDDAGGAHMVTERDAVSSDFEYREVAESENGYYVWERISQERLYSRLIFMDKDSRRVVPLCNRPDCAHEGEECNAYFSGVDFDKDGVDRDYLQYYEGSLYAVGLSADDYVALFRIKADGSAEWEICAKLYRTDFAATGHWRQPEIMIDSGYVYFIDAKQKMMKLERMPITGGISEVVYEGDKDASTVHICRVESNDDDGFLYFQVLNYFDDISENIVGGLYRCDTATGQCSLVKEGLSGPYSVKNGFVYYGNNEGLCCYSMQDGTTEILMDQSMDVPNITLTRDYIILCDQMAGSTLIIYDYEGNELATVPNTLGLHWYFGGNSELLFGECVVDFELSLCFLNLAGPVEELQWEELKADENLPAAEVE